MDNIETILFYSKYSPASKKLMSMLDDSSLRLKKVCIDNPEIRKKLSTAKDICVRSVPCIFIIYDTGGVEKYEGRTAFNWVEEIIDVMTPTAPAQAPPQTQAPAQTPAPPQTQAPAQGQTSMKDLGIDMGTDLGIDLGTDTEPEDDEFFEYRNQNGQIPKGTGGAEDILKTAQNMQKTRENDTSKT